MGKFSTVVTAFISPFVYLNCPQVQHVDDISAASRLIFPGVGAYGQAMDRLKHLGYVEALKDYIQVRDNTFSCIVRGMLVQPDVLQASQLCLLCAVMSLDLQVNCCSSKCSQGSHSWGSA